MKNSLYQSNRTLNDQMSNALTTMNALDPKITRLSFASYSAERDMLTTLADSTLRSWEEVHYEHRFSKLKGLKQAMQFGLPKIVDNMEQINYSNRVKFLQNKGYVSSAAIPCFTKGQFKGFVFLNSDQPNAFNYQMLHHLAPQVELIQLAIDSHQGVLKSLSSFAENYRHQAPHFHRDSYFHGNRMRIYTRLIASEIAECYQLDDEQVEAIACFSQYHDIGKATLPNTLIYPEKALTAPEIERVRYSLVQGKEVMREMILSIGKPSNKSIQTLNQIMLFQGELLDGSGYPNGLLAGDIPIAAHIVTVANIFDSMTTHKSDRQAWSITFALLELEKMVQAGKIDSQCVNALRTHQNYIKQVIAKYPEYGQNHWY